MDICQCQDLVITSVERCRDSAIVDTKLRNMNMYNIRKFTIKCFEFCWKRTIFTSKDDDTQVPHVCIQGVYIDKVLIRFVMN